MSRPRRSPEQRQQARRETVKRFNASSKGIAARTRWQRKRQAERVHAQAVEQQRVRALAEQQSREIRDDSGRVIAVRLSDGTIQALSPPDAEIAGVNNRE